MGRRVYAWRVNLQQLRMLAGSNDQQKLEQLRAKVEGRTQEGMLSGEGRAFQNWQLGGLGELAPFEDIEVLIRYPPDEIRLSGVDAVHAVISLCALLGAELTQYSFYQYRSHYDDVSDAFYIAGGEQFDAGEIFFHESSPPFDIPLPEVFPGILTIEAELVSAVAETLAVRGLSNPRWAATVATLRDAAQQSPEHQAVFDAYFEQVDTILRRMPLLRDNIEHSLEMAVDMKDDPVCIQVETNHLRTNAEQELNQNEDTTAVFEELVHWFESAAAERQGIVLLIY
ncbi:MAG: hypothetical protein AAFV53_13745 [Myxococcota bacterium]